MCQTCEQSANRNPKKKKENLKKKNCRAIRVGNAFALNLFQFQLQCAANQLKPLLLLPHPSLLTRAARAASCSMLSRVFHFLKLIYFPNLIEISGDVIDDARSVWQQVTWRSLN